MWLRPSIDAVMSLSNLGHCTCTCTIDLTSIYYGTCHSLSQPRSKATLDLDKLKLHWPTHQPFLLSLLLELAESHRFPMLSQRSFVFVADEGKIISQRMDSDERDEGLCF